MNTKKRFLMPTVLGLLLTGAIGYGIWQWYDANVDRSGWVEKDGVRFYQDFHADPVSGWLELEEGYYHFNPDGTPLAGWQELEGSTYYFGLDGVMATRWQKIAAETYYFGTDGRMREGWQEIEGNRYYFDQGKMVTLWQDIGGDRYYFGPEGIMTLGFAQIAGSRYCFGTDGVMLTGMTQIEEQHYLFREDGVMLTGWQETPEGRRYFHLEGPMALGFTEIDGDTYLFQEDGLLYTGWLEDGEYRYYFHPHGQMAVGPTTIDGEKHYFSPKGIEVILVNALNRVPNYYEMELKTVVQWHQVDTRCYDALVKMLEDCVAAGHEYTFNSAYRSVKEQTEILDKRTEERMEQFGLDYDEARKMSLQSVALPGTSEHHLGLAVDLLGEDAMAWLGENCWDYGFIVRYTAEKEAYTGIIDEPWHFRYVGTKVSLDMKDSGLCLEEYLDADPIYPEDIY